MKIFILLGHPKSDTLSGEFATVYEAEAKAAGHEVKRLNIGDLAFDPILHNGYRSIQELEPDLKLVQESIRWCDHFVFVYPVWWSATPALVKGMFDRMWLPGFAFRFHKNGLGWDKLLKGRTARVIALSKMNPWAIRFMFGDHTNEISHATFEFSGLKVRLTEIGDSEKLTDRQKQNWFKKVGALARKGR